jgi:hypothetical protein
VGGGAVSSIGSGSSVLDDEMTMPSIGQRRKGSGWEMAAGVEFKGVNFTKLKGNRRGNDRRRKGASDSWLRDGLVGAGVMHSGDDRS